MKKILVPTDFSDYAKLALDFAVEIAQNVNAKVKLINVFEYPVATAYTTMDVSGPDPAEGEIAKQMMEQARQNLDKLVSNPDYSGVAFEKEVKIGNPFINISEELTNEEVDMVVMGSKGASGIEEVLIGSNTEKVVRHAPCPVICVKQPTKARDIQNIVFATDFKDVSEDLISHLKRLQELFAAKIHFVRVNTLNNFEPDSYAKKRISKWIDEKMFKNYTTRIYNDIEEEEGIVHYAEEINADMLALGTHQRTGFGRLFAGSLAEDVVNHAKRPIWTYKISKSNK